MTRTRFWLVFLFCLVCETTFAQVLYPSSQHLGLQTATLENIMLLQNLRDPQSDCVGINSWALGYGLGGVTRGDVDFTVDDSPGTSQNTFRETVGGLLVGTDLNLGTDSRIGGFFAFNATSQSVANEKADVRNYFWGVYGKKDWGNAYFLGTGAVGHAHTESDVTANAFRGFVYGETGLNYRFGLMDFQPFWGLQYYHAGTGSATGYNAEMGVQVDASPLRTNSLRNVLGARLGAPVFLYNGQRFGLNCVGFWFHEFLSDAELGGAAVEYSVEGESLLNFWIEQQKNGRDWCVLAPTLDWKRGKLHLWAGYIALFNESEVLHLGQGGAEICW